jgi:sulfite exporter TauE/SafE
MNKLKIFLFTVLAVLITALGLYANGRKAGEKAEQLRQLERVKQQRKVIKRVEDHINQLPGDGFAKRLRDKWARD